MKKQERTLLFFAFTLTKLLDVSYFGYSLIEISAYVRRPVQHGGEQIRRHLSVLPRRLKAERSVISGIGKPANKALPIDDSHIRDNMIIIYAALIIMDMKRHKAVAKLSYRIVIIKRAKREMPDIKAKAEKLLAGYLIETVDIFAGIAHIRADRAVYLLCLPVLSPHILKTADDMMKVRNLGKKSLDEVQQKLATLGLSLRKSSV